MLDNCSHESTPTSRQSFFQFSKLFAPKYASNSLTMFRLASFTGLFRNTRPLTWFETFPTDVDGAAGEAEAAGGAQYSVFFRLLRFFLAMVVLGFPLSTSGLRAVRPTDSYPCWFYDKDKKRLDRDRSFRDIIKNDERKEKMGYYPCRFHFWGPIIFKDLRQQTASLAQVHTHISFHDDLVCVHSLPWQVRGNMNLSILMS